jgi:hypothetical protein
MKRKKVNFYRRWQGGERADAEPSALGQRWRQMCRSPKKKRYPDCKPEAQCRDVHACWITCVADSEQWGGKGRHSIRMRERKCGILRSRLFRMRDDCDFSNFFAVLVAGTKFPARETSEWMASRFEIEHCKIECKQNKNNKPKREQKAARNLRSYHHLQSSRRPSPESVWPNVNRANGAWRKTINESQSTQQTRAHRGTTGRE